MCVIGNRRIIKWPSIASVWSSMQDLGSRDEFDYRRSLLMIWSQLGLQSWTPLLTHNAYWIQSCSARPARHNFELLFYVVNIAFIFVPNITDAKPETFAQLFCIWAASASAICTKMLSISSAVRAPSIWVWESFWGFCAEQAYNATKDPTTLGPEWKTTALFCIMNSLLQTTEEHIRGCLVGTLCRAVPLPFSLTSLLWQCASAGLSMLTLLSCACFLYSPCLWKMCLQKTATSCLQLLEAVTHCRCLTPLVC